MPPSARSAPALPCSHRRYTHSQWSHDEIANLVGPGWHARRRDVLRTNGPPRGHDRSDREHPDVHTRRVQERCRDVQHVRASGQVGRGQRRGDHGCREGSPSHDQGQPGRVEREPDRPPARGLHVPLHGGRRAHDGPEELRDQGRPAREQQPVSDAGLSRLLRGQARAPREGGDQLLPVRIAERNTEALDLHAARLRGRHAEVPGALSPARIGRSRGRMGRGRSSELHPRQPVGREQDEADDHRDAERPRDGRFADRP